MINLELMNFHESTVIRFLKQDAVLYLELDDVLVGGNKSRVTLKVSPVSYVKIDGEFSEKALMELNDGEVLSLDVTESGIFAVIEWNDFSLGASVTKEYQISGNNVSVTVR